MLCVYIITEKRGCTLRTSKKTLQINYILTGQRHEITEKEIKAGSISLPLPSLTCAPVPSLEPKEAWFLWLDWEGHNTRKSALKVNPYDACILWFPLAGSLCPRAPKGLWHDPLTSKTSKSLLVSSSLVLGSQGVVQPPRPLTRERYAR